MQRRNSFLLALIAIGGVVALSWYLASRPGELAAAPAATATAGAPVGGSRPAAVIPVSNPAPSPAITPDTVAKWIAETNSADAGKRAAAITALAEAPRADALPVLGRILLDGEPQIDRPLALRSLRDLALNQGDDDGGIRDAVRHVIYHGDDFTNKDDVQEVLDIIEESRQK